MADLIQDALTAALLLIQANMEEEDDDAAAPSAAVATAPRAKLAKRSAVDTPVNQEAKLVVSINDEALTAAELEAIFEVTIHQDVEAPSSFSLRFKDDDALARAEDRRYNLGGKVTVSAGYDAPEPLITGDITGLEIDLTGGETPSLVVHGYDRRHRLSRGTRTDSYAKLTDSGIAERIARRNGLSFKGDSTTVTYDLVLQHEQSDLEFLKQRADRIGYEVLVEAETLYFRAPPISAKAALTLSMDGDVTEFYARMSALDQPEEVHVRGWDPKLEGRATVQDLPSMGGKTGASEAAIAFKAIPGTVIQVDQPVTTVDEAKAMARGQLEALALRFVRGEGTCLGNPELRAGKTLALTDLGPRFGGTYYIVSAQHTYTREQGYRTKFTVRRSATGTAGEGTAPPAPSP
ncbi:Phage protein D [Minicystis rosea]|nr:Phage protein D [Minicystis rosea]